MKIWKKVLSLGLVAAMAGSMLAACGGQQAPQAPQETTGAEAQTGEGAPEGGAYKIGMNYFGDGSFAIESLVGNQAYVVESMGSTAQKVSDNFQVDTIVQDIENMISSGCDGLIVWLPADFLYGTVIDICEEAQIPYVFADKVPSDPAVIEKLQGAQYFAGAVGPDNAIYGTIIADKMIEDGVKTALVVTGDPGDPTDTPRIEAFEKEFTSKGGNLLSVVNTEFTTMQSKTEDALGANPDVDAIYGTGNDYGVAAANAILAKNSDAKVYTSGLDSKVLEYLVDETNPVTFVNGDFWVSGTYAAAALLNYLNGNKLADASGKTLFVSDVQPFEVTADNYDQFVEGFLTNPCYSPEEIQAMVGADYDAFLAMLAAYSLDERTK